jgi:hypothetical protein
MRLARRLRQRLTETPRSGENSERGLPFRPLVGAERRERALTDGEASHEMAEAFLPTPNGTVSGDVLTVRPLLAEVVGALGGGRGKTTGHGYALAPSGSRQRLQRSRSSFERIRNRRREPQPSQRT